MIKEPCLTVNNLIEHREKELQKEERESGTKQPDTELTDRIDRWVQHLKDLDTIDACDKASKERRTEARLRARDR